MSFTVGHAQKMLSLCVKHAWCHNLIQWIPDSAPIDAEVLKTLAEEIYLSSGVTVSPPQPWSQYDMIEYSYSWSLVSQAAAACNITPAEWELRIFKPTGSSSALGGPLINATPLSVAKTNFLNSNPRAANPGATLNSIKVMATSDSRSAAFLMGARPYDMSKSDIEQNFPGEFQNFKNECEDIVWGYTSNYISSSTPFTRTQFINDINAFVATIRNTYPFV